MHDPGNNRDGHTAKARIAEISEYGSSFELKDAKALELYQSYTVRIQWENLSAGILSTVVQINDETGFVSVRFEEMSKEQFVQLCEFLREKEKSAFGINGFKVS